MVGADAGLLDAGEADWQPNLAETLRKMVQEEGSCPGQPRGEDPGGLRPVLRARAANPSSIADDLEAFYIERGGFLRKADLAAHVTRIEDPVSVNYRGYTVCKCGPWTQGPVLCQALRLLEGLRPARDGASLG